MEIVCQFGSLRNLLGLLVKVNQLLQGYLGIRKQAAGLCKKLALYACLCACCSYRVHGVCQRLGVLDHCRDDLLACDIDHSLCLDVDGLCVGLILDFRTGFQLGLGEYVELLEQTDGLVGGQGRDGIYHGLDVRKSAALCLLHPGVGVTVSIENDSLMLGQILLNQVMYSHLKVVCLLQYVTGLRERLCHDGVQHDVRSRDGVLGAYHTELKLVAGKRKR